MNAEGESEPLETETAITAKNPYNEPDPPGKPEIKDWGKNFAEIKWAPPASDGKSCILLDNKCQGWLREGGHYGNF